jgi:2-polyprenyl-3-methyl-5-hydroxy-6-metoxy-1,4-benzoquinol methylase
MSSEHHHHHHGHGHDFTKANEDHFDTTGIETLTSDESKLIGKQAAQAFLDSYNYDKENTAVLDFACGTGKPVHTFGHRATLNIDLGNISLNMAHHVKSIIGLDVSGRVVDYYNEISKKEKLDDKMSALKLNILEDSSALEGKQFDVIVVSLQT